MKQTIEDSKFVELTYRVIDQKTGHVLTTVEFPLGYVHGAKEPSIHHYARRSGFPWNCVCVAWPRPWPL